MIDIYDIEVFVSILARPLPGVHTADNHHLETLEKEPVTGGTRADAAALEAFLVRQSEVLGIRAGRDNHGAALMHSVGSPDLQRTLREIHLQYVVVDELRLEAFGLFPPELHELGALDALWEAGIILDVRRDHELSPRDGASDDERLQVRPGRIDRRGQAGGAGTDDDDIVERHDPRSRSRFPIRVALSPGPPT